jgi:hypothetical protein
MDSPSEPETNEPGHPAGERESEGSADAEDPAGSVEQGSKTPAEDPVPEKPATGAVDDAPDASADGRPGVSRRSPIRIGAVVAIAVGAAFVVWLLVVNDDDSSNAPTQSITAPATTPTRTTTTDSGATPPAATSKAELQALAADGTTVYWAGPVEKGYTLTLVKAPNGSVYVRYLPPGVDLSDPIPPSLVVATYPMEGALAAVKRAAKSPDSVSIAIAKGGTAVYSKSKPTNVYFAYPKSSAQIEVYDPSPGRALQLVTSGTVTPVAP